jgi:dihydroxyacetone kinase-like predicted kinase
MTSPSTLGADDLRAVMGGYRDALRLHEVDINRLNVYPVPDGDTGTNMALTLEAVVSELEGVDGAGLVEVCKAIGHGSLMGARGNSGVILSQLLRGMSERMAAAGEAGVGPDVLVDAIGHASELARRAVVRPVEGTILTVAAAAAPGTGRPMRWPGPPTCSPSWRRRAWSMPAAPGTCSCSMRSSSCSTAGRCRNRQGRPPRT